MNFLNRITKNKDNTTPEPLKPSTGINFAKTDALHKEAGISLEKHSLANVKAAVYLVLDYSGSMRNYYRDHSVQDFTEKVLAIGANLDDDGDVPIILFDSQARTPIEANLNNSENVVDKIVQSAGHMGTTNYVAAMETVIQHYQQSNSDVPALVIFQTDGSPDNRSKTEKALCEAANLPIFWQFVGFGNDKFEFLHKLDDLGVPQKRVVDNAGFFKAGNTPKNIPLNELYDNLLGEFPSWLTEAKKAGIVKN